MYINVYLICYLKSYVRYVQLHCVQCALNVIAVTGAANPFLEGIVLGIFIYALWLSKMLGLKMEQKIQRTKFFSAMGIHFKKKYVKNMGKNV